jgi:hypothetical protein
MPQRIIASYTPLNFAYGAVTKRPQSSTLVYKKAKQIIAFRPIHLIRDCCISETAFSAESAYGVPEFGWASQWQRPNEKSLQ